MIQINSFNLGICPLMIPHKLQKQFLDLFRKKFISKEFYEFIRPVGQQRPRIYGLPKIHKPDVSSVSYSFYVPFSPTCIG